MICVTRARIFWEPNPLPLGTIEDGRKKYGMPQMANKTKAVSSTSAETTKGIGIFFIGKRVWGMRYDPILTPGNYGYELMVRKSASPCRAKSAALAQAVKRLRNHPCR